MPERTPESEPRARQLGAKFRVSVANPLSLRWPAVCACCGETPETTVSLQYSKSSGPVTKTSRWMVPACNTCRSHIETAQGASGWYGIGCMGGALLIAAICYQVSVLFTVLCMAIWVSGFIYVSVQLQKTNKAEAEKQMKPSCTAIKFASYVRQYDGVFDQRYIDIFTFSNERYAVAFREMNNGKIG
jgi:hypothetical protein